MIGVEVECDNEDCPNGSEYVDVYHDHWTCGTPISSYLPEDWRVVGQDECGYPIVRCADCCSTEVRP